MREGKKKNRSHRTHRTDKRRGRGDGGRGESEACSAGDEFSSEFVLELCWTGRMWLIGSQRKDVSSAIRVEGTSRYKVNLFWDGACACIRCVTPVFHSLETDGNLRRFEFMAIC